MKQRLIIPLVTMCLGVIGFVPHAGASDVTAPFVSWEPGPRFLIPSQVNETVPVSWYWSAFDSSGICQQSVHLYRSPVGWQFIGSLNPSARSLKFDMPLGEYAEVQLYIADCAGNARYSYSNYVRTYLDDDRILQYSGTWTTASDPTSLGGTSHVTAQVGATASTEWVYTDRFGVVMTKGPAGSVALFIDGVKVKTITLDAASTKPRQLVLKYGFPSFGWHTASVRLMSGKARLDGILIQNN